MQRFKSARFIVLMASFGLFVSCSEEDTLFEALSPDYTRITFENRIQETDTFNILTEEYIFNGGGVAVADFNLDGLPDLFFSGNQVSNALYLNQGNLQFKDVSEASRITVVTSNKVFKYGEIFRKTLDSTVVLVARIKYSKK